MGDSPETTDSLPWNGEAEEADAPSAAELEDAGQNALFGNALKPAENAPTTGSTVVDDSPKSEDAEVSSAEPAQPYRVLARKYRPQTFAELIGQDAMVRTLANAIARDRLAHAFLMTGVRGVGKTSTARLIAKALNCIGPDGNDGPTISPCGVCEPCTAIAEGRHIDVIEMDAASHTGVDDVREIIEAVRYSAVSARYKIYIIDEVHMLSRNAFNALLKTLEEPPAHVKFLFATTEVDKLPVTVLSRTQRFDLRRIPIEMLETHFADICQKEGVAAEDEALHIIASVAEGSVRDGLSILDQAIAHADLDTDSKVTAERVRDMLGLADKSAQRRILGYLLEGDGKALLAAVDEQYSFGVEPLALIRAQMDLVHRLTVAQVSGTEPEGASSQEREQLGEWADRITAGEMHRLWQLMLKGHEEVRMAPDPLISLRMALLRALYASSLPDPGKLAEKLEKLGDRATSIPTGEMANEESAPQASLDWNGLVRKVDEAGELQAADVMRLQVRVVELSDATLRYGRSHIFTDDIGPILRDALASVTGKRWMVEEVQGGQGEPTLVEQQSAAREAQAATVRAHPLVKAALEAFPEAKLIEDGVDNPDRREIPWSRKA